jgi:K+-transporting ATPase ATPase B chain
MSSKVAAPGLFDRAIITRASVDAFRKLDPRQLARNPVIFVTEIVSAVVTLIFLRDLVAQNGAALFTGQIAAWLWFTVLFANFAEAVAEGRGKAQADALRKTRTDTRAKRLVDPEGKGGMRDVIEGVSALDLRIRSRDTRSRRRSLGRHRRHDRALGLDPGQDHRRAGFDLY